MKFNKKLIYSTTALALALALALAIVILSQNHNTMNYSDMNHTSGMEHSSDLNLNANSADHTMVRNANSVLTESGTDPFAVIQEAIALLEANPATDWSVVNIDALRSHLVAMQDMTLNVTVEQQPINLGFIAVVTPTTNRALESMIQVLSVHPSQMKNETGWDMTVTNNNGVFTISVTTDQLLDVEKIRGLGYIGIMAYGNHHQPHHWAMASGEDPHS
jgi:hypothetical protein